MPPERVRPQRTRRQTDRGAQYREQIEKSKELSKTRRRVVEARKQIEDLSDSFKNLKISEDAPPPPAAVEAVRDDIDDLADSFGKLRMKKTRRGGKHRGRRHRKTHRRRR